MEIKVTKTHLNAAVKAARGITQRGHRDLSGYFDVNRQCPLAQAIRAAKPAYTVDVYSSENITLKRGKVSKRYTLSKNGVSVMDRFDRLYPELGMTLTAATKKRVASFAARFPITITLEEYSEPGVGTQL